MLSHNRHIQPLLRLAGRGTDWGVNICHNLWGWALIFIIASHRWIVGFS